MVGGEWPLGLGRGYTRKIMIGHDSSVSSIGRRRRRHDEGDDYDRDDL